MKNILIITVLIISFSITVSNASDLFIESRKSHFDQINIRKINHELKFNDFKETVNEYYKKNRDEYFVITDTKLYYVNLCSKKIRLEELLYNLNTVKMIKKFKVDNKVFLIYWSLFMKQGIITETYSILEYENHKEFNTDNFYELYSFQRDDEESGENGIPSGQDVLKFEIRDNFKNRFPDLVFKIKDTDYSTKTFKYRTFKFYWNKNKYKKVDEI